MSVPPPNISLACEKDFNTRYDFSYLQHRLSGRNFRVKLNFEINIYQPYNERQKMVPYERNLSAIYQADFANTSYCWNQSAHFLHEHINSWPKQCCGKGCGRSYRKRNRCKFRSSGREKNGFMNLFTFIFILVPLIFLFAYLSQKF